MGQYTVTKVSGALSEDSLRGSRSTAPVASVDTSVERGGPRNLDSGFSEISIVFQAAVPKPVVPKYTTSGVRRPSER